MATLLLMVIYMAFIGLGLPDSLFGAAWPAIYTEYGLPLSFGSAMSVITFLGTTISSMCSARVINRFGTNKVTAFSTALTAENFGEELSPSIMGTQMAVAGVSCMVTPMLCGVLGQVLGMGIFPVYLAVFFCVMLFTMWKAKQVFMKK